MSFSGAILIEIVQNQLYGLPLENAGLEQNKIQFGVVLYGYFMNLCSFLNVLSGPHFSSKNTQWKDRGKNKYTLKQHRFDAYQSFVISFFLLIKPLQWITKREVCSSSGLFFKGGKKHIIQLQCYIFLCNGVKLPKCLVV